MNIIRFGSILTTKRSMLSTLCYCNGDYWLFTSREMQTSQHTYTLNRFFEYSLPLSVRWQRPEKKVNEHVIQNSSIIHRTERERLQIDGASFKVCSNNNTSSIRYSNQMRYNKDLQIPGLTATHTLLAARVETVIPHHQLVMSCISW